ncbi:MAG: hypothetical protein M1348_02625 [Candidatus Parvarchaeota archaeon]|nr:hypothetical protein [Candidatus Parvarchaeota archaeon]
MSLLDAFKKKEDGEVPDVTEMVQSGMSEQDIIDNLRQQGYDSTAIKNALVNATLAAGSPQNNPPQQKQPVTMPQSFGSFQQQDSTPAQIASSIQAPQSSMSTARTDSKKGGLSDQALDTIQQVLEQIIEEKWQSAAADITALKNGMKSSNADVGNIDDRVSKLNQRIDNLQNVMLGKTEEYNKTLADVNVELQAFEKVNRQAHPNNKRQYKRAERSY